MRNSVFVTRTRTLMLGKLASLSVLAAVAMILVTPLVSLANPSMCGFQGVNATVVGPIEGYDFKNQKVIPFPAGTTPPVIMYGTLLAVKITDKNGPLKVDTVVPALLQQPFALRGDHTYHSNAPILPDVSNPRVALLIGGIPNIATKTCVKMCTTKGTSLPAATDATFETVISSYDFSNSTFTSIPNEKPTVGSYIMVKLADGKEVPASISSNKTTPVMNGTTITGYTTKGFVYTIDGTTPQPLTISLSKDAGMGWT